MDYRIEVYDTWGRRIATFDETPLLEATRTQPDAPDVIQGILPGNVTDLGHAYRIRVWVAGACFCEGYVAQVRPQWSDTRKLILDRYVPFHEVIEVEAEQPARDGNTDVSRGYENRSITFIVKSILNSAPGAIHYRVAHTAYPDGAQREYQKFLARKTPDNELEIGGIAQGQWLGANRIDASGAFARDGDTISGLVVDGVAWPDLRLMMIDSEETSRNSHAVSRHPEVAAWTDGQYAASGYKFSADAAKQALQNLMDTKGIDYIELNPHRDESGAFDDRVDMYGRYLGFVYGGSECFNAALVEWGLADVYQWDEGRYHVPEMELKDYFSYVGLSEPSVEETAETLSELDVSAGALEVLTMLAYAAGGWIWSVDPDLAVHFRKPQRPDRVVFYDPTVVGVALGSVSRDLRNVIYFEGNPLSGAVEKTYRRGASIDAFGARIGHLNCFSISAELDADKLVEALLDDVAYPEPCGFLQFYHGDPGLHLGDLIEVRDGPLRRLEPEIEGEWGDVFTGRLVGRISRITHRFSGQQVSTNVWLTSPLRSVGNPMSFAVRSQTPTTNLYQFRLDDALVGVDMGYHLD